MLANIKFWTATVLLILFKTTNCNSDLYLKNKNVDPNSYGGRNKSNIITYNDGARDRYCGFFLDIPKGDWEDNYDNVPRPEDFEGLPWSERPLIPAEHREDLCMGEYQTNNFLQNIFMEEGIQEDVIIAQLNYNGEVVPVAVFISGTRGLLNLRFVQMTEHDNYWFIVVDGRQDYETLNPTFYLFEVEIPNEDRVFVMLTITNIDDNAPFIHIFDNCNAKEMGEPRLTDCVYEVTDEDGEISTRFMTFDIESNRGDERRFGIESAYNPQDWYRMTITITIKEPLDFEISALHIFTVVARDSLPNVQRATLMVEVENIPHRPPRWVEIWAVQHFNEKTVQQFSLRAIDGDTGINQAIHYTLNNSNNYEFFSIETLPGGHNGGIFHVDKIDRDELQQEVFRLGIIAYKEHNRSSFTEMPIVIIVDDVNDNKPLPFYDKYEISIREETPLTLNFENEFGFHDRDLGPNAQYNVRLETIYPPGAANAFYVAPSTGYQRQTFVMGTVNHTMLDYEDEPFQNISLKIIATEEFYPDRYGEAEILIYLKNWNDELPIFPNAVVETRFDETVQAGFPVATILGTDRDITDFVTHSLMGNAVDFLHINNHTGEITVAIDNAFNYHRQNELFVQIRGQDNFPPEVHTTTSQLIIRLNDINNTPPTLRLPRQSPEVEENVPEATKITEDIIATDPDTTALLKFEINWNETFAVKQGRETPPEEYVGCVEIITEYPNEENTRSAVGVIRVLELDGRPGVTIDFEEFEILYLVVRVVDHETVDGADYDELTLTINIIDMNDNAPIWDESTLLTEFRVRETSESGLAIGSVLATDRDGPLYNQIRYSITPRNNTPEGLVRIDPLNGQITVDRNEEIDADVPPRWSLYYYVEASDRCVHPNPEDCPPDPTHWNTTEEISIQILDRNNRIPAPEFTKRRVEIFEDVPEGELVVTVSATDLDRDVVHHTLNYQINFLANPRLRDFFEIDSATGEVRVHYPGDEVLDRDRGEDQHQMFFTIMDNFNFEGDGNRNSATENVEVTVILLDVNDNAPQMPAPSELSWTMWENLEEGHILNNEIYAPDIDEPGTDNSRVGYKILALTLQDDRTIEVPDLFTIVHDNYKTGNLVTLMPLRGYWGTYDIWIEAYDHGVPRMSDNETYRLVIEPYNFMAPEFVFPIDGTTVRLARERASVNLPLILVNGDTLPTIEAVDNDGLDAGIVDLQIHGNDEALDYFLIGGDGVLTLTRPIDTSIRIFEVKIRASDRGINPGPKETFSTLNVIFVPIMEDPMFTVDNHTIAVMEYEAGLEERHQLPEAVDNKNFECTDDCHKIYYHIIDGNDEGQFAVEANTNVLYLEAMLFRNESTQHTLVIAATNSDTPPATTPNSVLTVIINVREANPRPRFVQDLYAFGISADDQINRRLFTIKATHTESVTITYSIVEDSMEVTDPSLESVAPTAFEVDENTGDIILNHQPGIGMHGMFQFKVSASDGAETDEADVKIFIISDRNRVMFIFVNTLDEVQDASEFIAQTFSIGFNMTCNIDTILPATSADGIILNDRTEARAHFIRDSIPVPAEEIEELRSDTQLLRSIQNTLSTKLLILENFLTVLSPEGDTDVNQILVYALASLTALMLILFIALLLVYFFRTRALNRRLEALSTTKFGSMESNLNRAGITAPGTNKHATEGSNPMWNEQIKAPDFDALSEESGDEDLIGVEDLPQFLYDQPSISNGNTENFDSIQPGIADHSNNFGFNASPFSPEFGNMKLNS